MSDKSGEAKAFVETFCFVVAGEKATFVKYNAYAKIKVENERLNAEIERQQEKLIAIARDRDQLKAENERLRAFNKHFGHANKLHCGDVLIKNHHLRKLLSEAREALDKMLLAACWFHEGPHGFSPEYSDYKDAQKTLANLERVVGGEG